MFSDCEFGRSHQKLLSSPPVLQTTDVDEAASLLANSAVPYRSELLTSAFTFSTEIFCARSPRMHLSRVKTTGAMRVNAQLDENAYAVVFAVSGEVEHRVGTDSVWVRPGSGLVQSPSQSVAVRTPKNFELLFLKLPRDILTQELEKLLHHSLRKPLIFFPAFRVSTEAGKRFRQHLLDLFIHHGNPGKQQRADTGGRDDRSVLAARTLENAMVALLLEGQRHNYSRLLVRDHEAAPWQLRAAEEYIRANAQLTLSLGDICIAAGVPSRTLQHTFRRKRGYSPMQFLRQLRMERAYEDLSRAENPATVTEVATRWGFLHFGRFAGDYQARFGEKPSETLLRSDTARKKHRGSVQDFAKLRQQN
jgi:AraC-like DNA-binding protein